MKVRSFSTGLVLLCSISATAQVVGDFYLDKEIFAVGEPIFVSLRVVNNGQDTVKLCPIDDRDRPFCSHVSIDISPDPPPASTCGNAHSCMFDGPLCVPTPLVPGQYRVDRFLLNYDYEINAPGKYSLEAQYTGLFNYGETVHASLHFQVDASLAAYTNYQPWLNQLHSADRSERIEAARTLAAMAPPSLESTLLGLADDEDFRRFAPLAFHRLNTPNSMKALAELLKSNQPGSSEADDAAKYLAETNDQDWYPLLLDQAVKAPYRADLTNAAALGGEKILPGLVALEKTKSPEFMHWQAIRAMGYTRSRAAIPILLDLLKNSDQIGKEEASGSLWALTHRTANSGDETEDLQVQYIRWSKWWAREGATAPIYGVDNYCHFDPAPLPQ